MFHVHLINKKNVVATAIGRYLIRTSDIDPNGKYKPHKTKKERTLYNSIVIDISWPCILVFVEEWEKEEALIHHGSANIVPKTVYMPDGRVVPICIVLAPKVHASNPSVEFDKLQFPSNLFGTGFPAIVEVQGRQNIGTIGCLVTDGHKYFALTNKHVTGEGGEVIKSMQGTKTIKIGTSSSSYIGKKPFNQLYNGWQNNNMLVSCDTGLIEIDNISRWKTELPIIDTMDEIFDLNTSNISFGLIAEHQYKNGKIEDAENGKVIGYGAVSGLMEGEIFGLFYRYKSIGGMEYVSDFLIGGRNGETLNLHHGDSGSLWLIETVDENKKKKLQPIALHWGQHQFIEQKSKSRLAFSLSTCLSNICREMDVDLVRGWNIDLDYSWGPIGHYTVGNKAIDVVNNKNLKKFLLNNADNISFKNDNEIYKGFNTKTNKNARLTKDPDEGFCALADVPDIIWKQYKLSADGTKGTAWGRKGDENPNHYADADAPTTDNGKTLYDLCDSQDKMTVEVWQNYYNNIDKAKIGLDPNEKVSNGLICFRVWQIFDYMVEAASKGHKDKFIFGAGVITHYLGDACQPLHSSYMSDGNPVDNKKEMYTPPKGGPKHPKGVPYERIENAGSGVHVAYEDHMIDDYITSDIMPGLKAMLEKKTSAINKETIIKIDSGQAAAFAVLQLMKLTQETITPIDIVETFKSVKGTDRVSETLYEQFGERTIEVLARGCKYLAAIWDAAWEIGNGNSKIKSLTKVKEADLIALYREPSELPSLHLDTIAEVLIMPK